MNRINLLLIYRTKRTEIFT